MAASRVESAPRHPPGRFEVAQALVGHGRQQQAPGPARRHDGAGRVEPGEPLEAGGGVAVQRVVRGAGDLDRLRVVDLGGHCVGAGDEVAIAGLVADQGQVLGRRCQVLDVLASHTGHQEGVAIEHTPLGLASLFGMPAAALWNTSVELADVVGAPGRELWERLQGVEGWPARFATGTAPVADVAAEVGWSRQHLSRRFATSSGSGRSWRPG